MKYVVGIDEAGRGPLAGPVSVTALSMSKENYTKLKRNLKSSTWLGKNGLPSLKDSKKLTEAQRELWYIKINEWKKEGYVTYLNSMPGASQIDERGIAVVIRSSIKTILKKMVNSPADYKILLDGSLRAPEIYSQETIIKGDELEPVISLASIVAKVKRDRKMKVLDEKYPGYELGVHKGYGTKRHRELVMKKGLSKIHRGTFCGNIIKE